MEAVARKWENLPIDCLVNIFGRVGLESLLADIPLVCSSWYKATLSPFCWKELDFPDILDYPWLLDLFFIRSRCQYRLRMEICMTKFLKVVVDRSGGCATMVELPSCYTRESLTYVAHKCAALKKLVLHSETCMLTLSLVIGKFKNLESLEIESDLLFKDIVTEIGSHCEKFVALSLVSASACKVDIGNEEVMAIVTCLPKLKYLTLRNAAIARNDLICILKGCVELVHLDVRDCRGFSENDVELWKLASHISKFKCSASFIGSVFDALADVFNSRLQLDSDNYYSSESD